MLYMVSCFLPFELLEKSSISKHILRIEVLFFLVVPFTILLCGSQLFEYQGSSWPARSLTQHQSHHLLQRQVPTFCTLNGGGHADDDAVTDRMPPDLPAMLGDTKFSCKIYVVHVCVPQIGPLASRVQCVNRNKMKGENIFFCSHIPLPVL